MKNFYHVTKSENVKNILKDGLIPSLGKYATKMGETKAAVWLFPCIEDAKEMTPIWLMPFYGPNLSMLKVELPDNYPLEYTGSDYEVCAMDTITPDCISLVM